VVLRLHEEDAEDAMTVGLSFGSATSGEGFDVSSTVSTIVANLQKVETPWSTQLASLGSQDTVISSLGSLFSSLSTEMSALTDVTGGVMSVKSGSVSDSSVIDITAASSSAVAGTYTVEVSNLAKTSSGYLSEISKATDKLSGTIAIQVGSSTALTLALTSGDNTLASLAKTINSAGVGVTASVLTDTTGTRLSLVSKTSGAPGNISVSANIQDTSNSNAALTYTNAVTGTNATITVDGATLTLASNTVSDVIPGVTFQLLAPSPTESDKSLESVQLVIANYNTGVVSTVEKMVSDYNTLVSAINTQEGDNTSGVALPLFGSPTLSLLQEQLLSGIRTENPSGYLSSITDGTDTTLSGSMTFTAGSGATQTIVIGSGSAAANTYYTGSGVNTLAGLAAAINAASVDTKVTATVTAGADASGSTSATTSSASLSAVPNMADELSGSIVVQVGSDTSTAQTIVMGSGTDSGNTIYTGSGVNTLAGLASSINTASTSLTATVTAGTENEGSVAKLTSVPSASSTLSGSIAIQVGSGTTETFVIGSGTSSGDTIYTGSGVNTLAGLEKTISDAGLGVSATVTTASNGAETLYVTSGTNGSAGLLTVTPTSLNAVGLGYTASVTTAANGTQTLSLTSATSGKGGTLTVTPSNLIAEGTGVTASIADSNGKSTLTLLSQTAGSAGALTVTPNVSALSDTALKAAVTDGTDETTTVSSTGVTTTASATASTATLTTISNASDKLTGALTITVGNGTAQTITVGSSSNTLSTLSTAINDAKIGVTASVVTTSSGSYLSLTSGTAGTIGDLSVTSSVLDTTDTTTSKLSYTSSSDINSLTGLGISVNNDGSLSLDATSLNSVLNSDYSGVIGFFQNSNSWGLNFSDMLTNAGTSSTTGVLSLSSKSNSTIESKLNADISREENLISTERSSITKELTSANEIMQEIPSQLSEINELYSAVTGYNKNSSS
jgi:flagellar hook-associated protein 2